MKKLGSQEQQQYAAQYLLQKINTYQADHSSPPLANGVDGLLTLVLTPWEDSPGKS